MKGPLQLIRRRRGAEAAPHPAPEPDTDAGATAHGAESTTSALPALEGPAVPAGVDPVEARRPTFRTRARARRRLRYLRRVRELGFRDLGGLLFDQHRFNRPNEELVRGKLDAIAAVDHELRALERVLDDRRPITELREPGLSACPRCGALHASEARFCSSCGLQLRGPRAVAEIGEAAGGLAAATPPVSSITPPMLARPEPPDGPDPEPPPPPPPAVEQPTTVMEPATTVEPGAGRDRPPS
jgi:hypothetical protein